MHSLFKKLNLNEDRMVFTLAQNKWSFHQFKLSRIMSTKYLFFFHLIFRRNEKGEIYEDKSQENCVFKLQSVP